jgi:hypothetical protein
MDRHMRAFPLRRASEASGAHTQEGSHGEEVGLLVRLPDAPQTLDAVPFRSISSAFGPRHLKCLGIHRERSSIGKSAPFLWNADRTQV